ncbi:MAG: hypothetical protein QW520_06980 [Methanomassiliicoccales archaeon]
MDKEKVKEVVRKKIEEIPGIVAFQYLDQKFKGDIIALEKAAEDNGACGGLMPFINKGVWSCMSKEEQFVIVVKGETLILSLSKSLVFLEDQEGQVIGEWVNPSRLEELKKKDNVCFLSEDFVLYSDVNIRGEPRFVLPAVDFHYLDDIEGVENVVSGSVSTLADEFIREKLGYLLENHWTHLVGFDIKKQ